jgi:virulence-associated protein VagC
MNIRPIRTESDRKDALLEIAALMASDPAPGTPKGDRLDVLVTLLQAYEARHLPIDPPDAIEAIRCRMQAGDLTVKAKLFIHRGGQAVRVPDEFRFEGREVHVRRVGNEVALSPVQPPTADALIDALMAFEMHARARREQPAEQERRTPIRRAR